MGTQEDVSAGSMGTEPLSPLSTTRFATQLGCSNVFSHEFTVPNNAIAKAVLNLGPRDGKFFFNPMTDQGQ